MEYCDKKETLIREQYYLDLLNPEELRSPPTSCVAFACAGKKKKAGSPLGFKHSEETKDKLRGAKNFSPEHLLKIKEHINKLNSQHSVAVVVSDTVNGTSVEYASIRLTCPFGLAQLVLGERRKLKCADVTIKNYIDSNNLFRKRYIISSKANKKRSA